jgi:hypothetical protein
LSSKLQAIEILAKDASISSANELQEIERTTDQREIRKAARKALYNLSLAGILPTRLPPLSTAKQSGGDELRAFASAFDGAGNRLLLFLIPDSDGGASTLLQITTNDLEGVSDCQSIKIRRRDVADRISRIKAQVDTGLAVAEIEPDYGRILLARSRSLTASISKRSPSALLAWIPKIGEPGQESETDSLPPIYAHVSADVVSQDPTVETDPIDFFKLTWIDPWFYAAEETIPWLTRWETAWTQRDPEEELNVGPDTPLYMIASEAAPVLMTDKMRKLYIVRLEETADVLWRCGKEAEAKQAVYHAAALKTDADAAYIPFAHTLALRTIGAAFEMVLANRERRAGG